MNNNKVHILSTRQVGPLLVKAAADKNIILEEIPFIKTEIDISERTEKIIISLLKETTTVVFTSMNAVEALRKYINMRPEWKIYCIGYATKDVVEEIFGSNRIAGTSENAGKLAEKIISDSPVGRIYFFCGNQRRDELPGRLKKDNFVIEELQVYKTIETPVHLSRSYEGILFFSPSAVKSFFSKNSLLAETVVFSIGNTTAKTVKLFTSNPVIKPENPGKENLVTLAITYFSKSKS
jgi:uroporphyrinogen-III synthase